MLVGRRWELTAGSRRSAIGSRACFRITKERWSDDTCLGNTRVRQPALLEDSSARTLIAIRSRTGNQIRTPRGLATVDVP